jgi:hypothetical protein
MRSLSAAELLEVWERASGEHPVDRALTLLCACSGEARQELAALSIGQRDARLLQIYERMFGAAIEAFAQCPECGERLEYRVSISELVLPTVEKEMPLILETEEARMSLRLPNSVDLRAASECCDVEAARTVLLERCIIEHTALGSGVRLQALPEATVEKVAACLAEADPQAEMLIDLTCCACRHGWQVILDIENFLWLKIHGLAKRLLREVHALARAYGWRELDILGLSSLRRQSYLEMAGSWPTF